MTKRYKCHVFRCDIPAKAIANALHEICARVMSERQKGHTISMVTQGQMIQQQQQQQLMQMRSISLDSNKEGIPTSGMYFGQSQLKDKVYLWFLGPFDYFTRVEMKIYIIKGKPVSISF